MDPYRLLCELCLSTTAGAHSLGTPDIVLEAYAETICIVYLDRAAVGMNGALVIIGLEPDE